MAKGHTYVQWIVAIVLETTVMSYGLTAGWISPMKLVLQSEESPVGRPVTDMEMTWVASILPLAAVTGVLLFVYVADRYGRKSGVLVMAISQACCWTIKLSTANVPCLIIARIFAGIPAGGCLQLMPIYVKEISQDNIRGMLVSMIILMQNIGVFTMYAIGAYCNYASVLYFGLTISLISIAALIKVPESPSFLVKMEKYEEAEKTLALLRGLDVNDKIIQDELSYLKNNDTQAKDLPDVTIFTIFKNKSSRSGLFVILMIISVQATNGSYGIFTYASSVISAAGVTLNPHLQTLSIPIVMIVGSFVSISCVERIGRKVILASAFALSTLGLIGLGCALTMQHLGQPLSNWIPAVSIVITVGCYAAGILPMPYVIMAEMFSFNIRAKVSGCICCYAWFVTFLQLLVFIPISSLVGMHNTMFCFSAINLLGVLVALVVVPETKGKSVEQIEEMLELR
ncbi:facilitated trehalose transporter Tret1-like [Plodia interpunctella]|uniref:facilitated trehalose transporter Tret1-like n=1 Tax=Plodia interpunctella TaxID=58824 RepID=UPI0023674BA5|nr:facilitated trehalose transporter Tret1-like [Plodia interpunctella]